MKILFLLIAIMIYKTNVSAQDSLQLMKIDSLELSIDNLKLHLETDSLIKSDTINILDEKMILKTRFYGSWYADDSGNLKKLIWHNNVTQIMKGEEQKMIAKSVFYYNEGQLIKLDETLIEGEKNGRIQTYYSGDKVLYCTSNSEKSESRSAMMLELSKTLLLQYQNRKKK